MVESTPRQREREGDKVEPLAEYLVCGLLGVGFLYLRVEAVDLTRRLGLLLTVLPLADAVVPAQSFSVSSAIGVASDVTRGGGPIGYRPSVIG